MEKSWKFPRQKTAIHHPRVLSIAAGAGLRERLIRPDVIVLDYGCGFGDDVMLLRQYGNIHTFGYDPYRQTGALESFKGPRFPFVETPILANVVLLSNVINVIEDPKERKDLLHIAFDCATRCLIVTAYDGAKGKKWGDGVVTQKGTFQRPYSREEFGRLVWGTLRKELNWARFHPRANLAFVFKKEVTYRDSPE